MNIPIASLLGYLIVQFTERLVIWCYFIAQVGLDFGQCSPWLLASSTAGVDSATDGGPETMSNGEAMLVVRDDYASIGVTSIRRKLVSQKSPAA
ncbi:MAG: hypothetical protein Q8M20_11040 [Rhodocyclaceae bacterium]|nr:hypothetical protein [Rhodocyclaceae bacterium]MDZ4215425.1 hypothetical protein [Rhodocyclaceae bacterium]